MTATQTEKATRFRALHDGPGAFVIPNPWDAGSARILAGLGFPALATSSGASAGILGRRDGQVSRDEALAHARAIVLATDLPVSADLENGFGHSPAATAVTIRLAAEVGVVGGSIEDATGDKDKPIYDIGHAIEHVAAVRAARAFPFPFMLTAARRSPARQARSRRHDPALAGFRADRRGCAVRAGPARPGRGSRGVCRGVETGQLHGRHPGSVVHGRRARSGRRAAGSASPPRCIAPR